MSFRRIAVAAIAIAVIALVVKLAFDSMSDDTPARKPDHAPGATRANDERRTAPRLEGQPPVPDVPPPHETDQPILPPEKGPLPADLRATPPPD